MSESFAMAAVALTRHSLAHAISGSKAEHTTDQKADQNVRHVVKPDGYRTAHSPLAKTYYQAMKTLC